MSELDQFIDQIISEKNLSGVTDDVRQVLHDDLKIRLSEQIDSAVLDALSEEQMAELAAKTDESGFTPEVVQQYIAKSGINVEQITLETMLRFRMLYLQNPDEASPKTAQQEVENQIVAVDQMTEES